MNDNMAVAAVIAEFSPFHNGHEYLFSKIKERGFTHIIVIMSGDYCQRGDLAIYPKMERARAALKSGASLVLELPLANALSSAQFFAEGAVEILSRLGVPITLFFGSECGDMETLYEASLCFNKPVFLEIISKGVSYGEAVAASVQPHLRDVLRSPNNLLGVEYLRAVRNFGDKLTAATIKRTGAVHDSGTPAKEYASASFLRELIKGSKTDQIQPHVPPHCFHIYRTCSFHSIGLIEAAVLSVLRRMTVSDLSEIQDVSEGLENRIYRSARNSLTLPELYGNIKTKRYSHSRVRRLVLASFLGLKKGMREERIRYARVLGINKNHAKLLSLINEKGDIRLLHKFRDIEKVTSGELFFVQQNASDQFYLAAENRGVCGLEYTNGVAVI